MLFFNIDFSAFWLRFWRLLGLQLGAKLAQNASAERKVAYFWTFLSWCLYNIAPWRAPASILEAPGLDLGGRRLNFFKIFACFWPCVPRTCRDLAQLVDRNLDARLHWTPHSQPLNQNSWIFHRYGSLFRFSPVFCRCDLKGSRWVLMAPNRLDIDTFGRVMAQWEAICECSQKIKC